MHRWAGHLLFNSGSYEDAVQAYSHSEKIKSDPQLLFMRSKCYICNLNFTDSYEDIN